MFKGRNLTKLKKINSMSQFDKRKLDKENQKNENQLIDTYKYFGKKRIKKSISLGKIFLSLPKKEIYQIKSRNTSIAQFQRKKPHFDTTRPVYIDNRKNIKELSQLNSVLNNNILNDIERRVLGKNNNINFRRNKLDSRKLIIYKQFNSSGFDRHIVTSKSCNDIFSENKNTSDIKFNKTREINILESQKFLTNTAYNFNISNKLKDKQSILSTVEYSNINRKKNFIEKKYKYSRENILQSFADMNKLNFKIRDKRYLINRKKYYFVQNDYLIDIEDYSNLKKEVERFNNNSLALLKKENGNLFSYIGSIVSPKKFSEKYRDPLNNSFEAQLKEENNKKEKKIINLDILSGVELLKEIKKYLEKIKTEKNVSKGKHFLYKLKRIIIKKMAYLDHLKVSLGDILKYYKISKTAYSYPQTDQLIMAIRNKDYSSCCDILDKYKYIVLDFDYFHLTALHWAAKLNYFEIIPKLMEYGAYVNEKDLWGNTPLHISVSRNYFETTIFLLIFLASPFSKDNHNKTPIDCSKDLQFNYIFKKITDIHLKCLISRQKFYYENVQKEFINFAIFELSNLLNPIALSLIKDLKKYYK